jgi:pilus assembly protein CpaE
MNQATPEVLEKLLAAMQETFDFIVIDGGQTIDELSLKILEMANQVLLVASLSLPCLTNVKRLLWGFQKLGYPWQEKVKIIVNRHQKNSLISLREAEESLTHKIFWQIPNDFPATMEAINQGKPLFQVGNGAEICKSIRELAASFMGKATAGRGKTGFWSKIVK